MTAPSNTGLKLLQQPKRVEASFWRRLRFDQAVLCRDLLFDRYMGLARAVARGEFRRRPPYGLDRADFEQLAFRGLLEAIDRYDPLRGTPFEAYARHRIRGAIADGVAASSESGAQFSHRQRLERERMQSLRSSTPVDPVTELADLAAALAIGIMAAEGAHRLRQEGVDGLEAYDGLVWRELEIRVGQEIGGLPEKERLVLQRHYFDGVAFNEIADLLGVTKSRVSQLHRAALMRVRARLRQRD